MQSVSEWAPSCIGPYAQAVSVDGLAHFAGQIGLDPPTMTLVAGGPEAQAMQCLRSCHAVSTAAKADLQHAMLGCTVYAASAAPGASAGACPDAARQPSAPEMPGCAPVVAQTFSHVQQILAAFQQDESVQPGAADSQPEVPGKPQQTGQSPHPSSGTEQGELQGSVPTAGLPLPKGVEWEELDEEEVEVDEEGEEQEGMEESVDEYLRQGEAAVSVPWPLLTFVEAEALPRGAALELQPLALSSSQHDRFQGALQCCHSEGCLVLV